MRGFSFLHFIMSALIGAVVLNMLVNRREAPAVVERPSVSEPAAPFKLVFKAGEWMTMPDGARVCRFAYDVSTRHTLNEGFCVDWQPGFEPLKRGMTLTGREGYTRNGPGGYAQFHTERGWVP